MHKVRQNIRSTQAVTATEITEENKDKTELSEEYLPPRNIKNRDHIVQITAVKFEDLKGMTSSGQTGAFPHTSAKENRYVMVIEDSNAGPILATGIKSRKKEHLKAGFISMHDTLKKAGINPITHRIENKFSKDLIEEIEGRNLKYQIAPPGNHRTFPAEGSIQKFKYHFESILFECNPGYPQNQWARLTDVAILTLNMM